MCLSGPATIEQLAKKIDLPGPGGEVPEGAIVGWRVWKLRKTFGRVRLVSTASDVQWVPQTPMKAHKKVKSQRESVGVHAVADVKDVEKISGWSPRDKDVVLGKVLLWGTLARHEEGVKGFRAEKGYPLALYTNDVSAQVKLRNEYDCSVARLSAKTFVARKRAA